jgi:hypothetical protein
MDRPHGGFVGPLKIVENNSKRTVPRADFEQVGEFFQQPEPLIARAFESLQLLSREHRLGAGTERVEEWFQRRDTSQFIATVWRDGVRAVEHQDLDFVQQARLADTRSAHHNGRCAPAGTKRRHKLL